MQQWLKDAIFYEIYPQSFYDSNGDGIGDLQGIISKLDYVKDIGCNAIWLNPCYDSPFMDAGYDVRNHKKVAKRYGTNEDLIQLFNEVHKRNMHILIDLVPGHTSDTHPWFLESKNPIENELSGRYIWTNMVWDAPPEYRLMCGITDRDGNYMVNYFSSQPALNYGFNEITHPKWQQPCSNKDCKATVEALKDIMIFWLERGCDGFRIDMADSLVKNDDSKEATAKIWKYIMTDVKSKYPNSAYVAEWCNPQMAINKGLFDMDFYLDHDGNGYHNLFRNIDKNGKNISFFCKEGKGDCSVFAKEYTENLTKIKGNGYISMFTCCHDNPRMTKTLDEKAIKLAYATIFTMPGVPFLYYGDEIGMKYQQLVSKEGGFNRTGSRTPMQWSNEKNLGFSTADEKHLYLPVDTNIDAPNVEKQKNDKDSMLCFIKELLALRKVNKELGAEGDFEILYAEKNEYPLMYKRGKFIVAVNPSGKQVSVPINQRGKVIYSIGDCNCENKKVFLNEQSFCVIEAEK